MLKLIMKTGSILAVLWGVKTFILEQLNISVQINSAGLVTAIICVTIIFCAVVIPFLIFSGD